MNSTNKNGKTLHSIIIRKLIKSYCCFSHSRLEIWFDKFFQQTNTNPLFSQAYSGDISVGPKKKDIRKEKQGIGCSQCFNYKGPNKGRGLRGSNCPPLTLSIAHSTMRQAELHSGDHLLKI